MPQLTNNDYSYGLISILLHWSMAALVIGLFILGVYMVELDYYDSWYNAAPWWHISIGMATFFLLLIRLAWVIYSPPPGPLSSYQRWERLLGKLTHRLFYLLLIVVSISGYLITTATGAPIDFFGWFEIPALFKLDAQQALFFGKTHAGVSYLTGLLFCLHLVASFKHHYTDADITLIRILKPMTDKERINENN